MVVGEGIDPKQPRVSYCELCYQCVREIKTQNSPTAQTVNPPKCNDRLLTVHKA